MNGVFLDAYLAPFQPWLKRDDVSEIMVNRPGEIWVEGAQGMIRHEAPVDDRLIQRLAEQVARISAQAINRESPLLGATLPDGARIQIVAPPATRGPWAMAIRRHRLAPTPLEAWAPRNGLPAPAQPLPAPDRNDPIGWLRRAVAARATILIAGGTSSGKTTFLNALLEQVPHEQRVVLVEDAPEIQLRQANALGLVSVRSPLGEALVDCDDLLQASLRLRPDRIVLGEMRGREAVSFLRAVNTGHPGSFSTIHANSCRAALEQLALMVMQTGLGLSRADTLAYVGQVIDGVVHLARHGGERVITDVQRPCDLIPIA
jgi:type IV secretion system protein VirB11